MIQSRAREREEAAGSGPRLLPRSGHSSNLQSTIPSVTDHFPRLLRDRHALLFPVAGADQLLSLDRAPAALAHQLLPRDVFPATVADDDLAVAILPVSRAHAHALAAHDAPAIVVVRYRFAILVHCVDPHA